MIIVIIVTDIILSPIIFIMVTAISSNCSREVCDEITSTRDVSLLFHFAGITDVNLDHYHHYYCNLHWLSVLNKNF